MIKKFLDLNLTAFVVIVLTFSLFVPSIISSYALVYHEKQKQVEELHRFKNSIARVFAASLAIPLWEMREDSAMTAIEPLLNDDRIAFLRVKDLQTNEYFINITKQNVEGNVFEAQADIFNNTTLIGTLSIGISDVKMQKSLRQSINSFIFVFLFQLVVSILILSFALYFKILKPMKTLANQARTLSKNNLHTPFIWQKNDEIGKLGHAFEYARYSLQQSLATLEKQKRRLESIIEGTNVGTWEWNVQTGETVFNEKWAQIIGYELRELQPVSIDTWAKYAHPDHLQKSNEALQKHFEGKSDYDEFESRMLHKKGHYVWVLDRGKVTKYDDKGSALIMAGTHQDISLRKYQEQELERLNKKLQDEVAKQVAQITQKDKMLQEQAKLAAMGEMIGAIAHQWRQPLNALSIHIQNLEDDYEEGLIDETFVQEFIAKQTKTINFMSKTIDDFRNFFKTDKTKSVFSMHKVARSVQHLLSAQLKNYNITLQINDEDFEVEGYKSEMQQVLLNVISNSKDAIFANKSAQGMITVTLEAKNKTVTIQDNGGGVAPDKLSRIFEPYFTTKEQGKGTGIGLHISRIIVVEHMKGSIRAYNTQGGLCIEITLV
jgi:PAS domain S-box-containing protein